MNEKQQKAKEIHVLAAELSAKIKEAEKMGLTVEIRLAYSANKKEDAIRCNIGEYIPLYNY